MVWEEVKDAILLTTFQTAEECLVYFGSPDCIHSFVYSLIEQILLECLLFARHCIECWASAMNKNSLCVCPEEL